MHLNVLFGEKKQKNGRSIYSEQVLLMVNQWSTNENGIIGKICNGHKCKSHWCPLSNFYGCKTTSDKLTCKCKNCINKQGKEFYNKTKKVRLSKMDIYYQKNRDKILKQHRESESVKKCNNDYWTNNKNRLMKTHQIKRRKRMDILKVNGCAICGYWNRSNPSDCMDALDFHHVNPDDKEFGVNIPHMSYKPDRIISEVNKCILLCKNCHTEVES